jgi:hypothetical protein
MDRIDVWELGSWVKKMNLTDVKAGDVFRLVRGNAYGAALIAPKNPSDLIGNEQTSKWTLQAKVLNLEKTVVCRKCQSLLDLSIHSESCPICRGKLEKISKQSKMPKLSISPSDAKTKTITHH